MNLEEFDIFWEKCWEGEFTENSAFIIEGMSQELSEEVREEYDIGTLVTEFTGHYVNKRKFKEIAEFQKVLRKYHPDEYDDTGSYTHKALVKYYCFKDDRLKIEEQIEDILSMKYDYDLVFASIQQMFANEYIDQVDKFIEREFEAVKTSPELIGGSETDFAVYKMYIELEKAYKAKSANGTIDWEGLNLKLKKYGLIFDPEFWEYCEIGFGDNANEKIRTLLLEFSDDRGLVMGAIKTRFLVKMLDVECPFLVSGILFDKLYDYFIKGENRGNWAEYFKLKRREFISYVRRLSGFFGFSRVEEFLVVWGSDYFLDLLKELDVLDSDSYDLEKAFTKKLKQEYINQNEYDLWEYNFVHRWKPAEGISDEFWEKERLIFVESFDLEKDYSNYERKKSVFADDDELKNRPIVNKRIPISRGAKIGRNEKVSVKYSDGRIVNDVKYKKVEKDLENGKCELI